MAQPQQRTAATASVPAPIGGWNARDSLAEMNPMDAVQLINFFPTPSDVTLRKGYSKASTGITGQVNTLMNYATPTTQKLFAAAGSVIYDASTSTATSVATGLANDKFQHVNITTAGGNFLVAVNGVDPMLIHNGTLWIKAAPTATAVTISSITRGGTGNLTATVTTASPHFLVSGNQIVVAGATESNYNGTFIITVTGSTTFTYTMLTAPSADASVVGAYTINFAITGVNSSNFIHVNLFKNRLYFVEKNSLKVWYLPVNSIAGAASELNFGAIAKNGGFMQAMGTWTLDAGEGVDDYAVFVTNMGEVIVYNGTDPSDVATWALKGIWQIGYVFARRCFFKWSGDLLLLTQDGLVPLSGALQSSRLDPRINLTDKIFYAVSQAADQYSENFGWQIHYFAKPNMLILNIPVTGGSEQYVMHTITKSWARFTGMNATCFEMNQNDMYFGGDGYVGLFYSGFSDDGQNIDGSVQQAYSYFDSRGQLKRFTMVRPILVTNNGIPAINIGVNIDFDTQNQLGAVTFNPIQTTGAWDAATWDLDTWYGGGFVVSKIWQGVTGIGYAAGVVMNVASQGIDVRWASTDFVMERGGVI